LRLDSLNAGANDFIGKPVDFSELLIKIRNLVQMKEFEDIKVQHDVLAKTVKAIETAKQRMGAEHGLHQGCRPAG